MTPMPKPQIWRSKKYADTRNDHCAITGALGRTFGEDVVPAHQRWLSDDCGTGIKPSDAFIVPMLHSLHSGEHTGALSFWKRQAEQYQMVRDPEDEWEVKNMVAGICLRRLVKYAEANGNAVGMLRHISKWLSLEGVR